MRALTDLNEIRKIELDILLHFDTFCKQNGLRYFLAYGTLIGAVRHQGFIPWDDDIDVLMPRTDYNWLIANYNKCNQNGGYRVVSPIEDLSPFSFVKFVDNNTVKVEGGNDYSNGTLGIDIDVFPLDGQPDGEEEYKNWYRKLKKIYTLHIHCSKDRSTVKRRILVPLFRLVTGGQKRLIKRALRLHSKYPYEGAKYVGAVESTANSINNRFKKECFDESMEVAFEGHLLPIPIGYDDVLRKMYGDYMKVPPVEYQVPQHTVQCYIKSEEI